MKVLILSHNSLSQATNMGKTLLSYFTEFPPQDLAQFYIHREVPTQEACGHYYRFTDTDALRSRFSKRDQGRSFRAEEIQPGICSPRTDLGMAAKLYQLGRKRTALTYTLRESLWKNCKWNTPQFRRWVYDFGTELLFLAAGDYGFLYEIAVQLSHWLKIPLAVACVDEFYLHNRNEGSWLGRWRHRQFLRSVERCMTRAEMIFAICPGMAKAYEMKFGKKCRVLHTGAPSREVSAGSSFGLSYLGNLGYRRDRQLVAMGRALREIQGPGIPQYIDVYSGERNPKVIRQLTLENGIRFHGMVSPEEAAKILRGSLAVIHTESFDADMRNLTRFSVSTKIPDCLKNGPCILAYGPRGIASMDYLEEHRAAYVITTPEDLHNGMRKLLTDSVLRGKLVTNARDLAKRHHDAQTVSRQLYRWLEQLCGEKYEAE